MISCCYLFEYFVSVIWNIFDRYTWHITTPAKFSFLMVSFMCAVKCWKTVVEFVELLPLIIWYKKQLDDGEHGRLTNHAHILLRSRVDF